MATRIESVTGQTELLAVIPDHNNIGPCALVLSVKPTSVIGLDRAGIATLRAVLDEAEQAFHNRDEDAQR